MFGHVPWLFKKHPETLIQKTEKLIRITPQTISIPKRGIFLITLASSIAQRQRPTHTWWPKTTLTWWQEVMKRFVTILTQWKQLKKKIPTAPLLLRRANKRRRVPQVNLSFAVRIPLQQLRQTRFCWLFSNWRRTPTQPISIRLLAEFRKCLNPSQRQCLRLTENQRNSNCLKICSQQIWKSQSADSRRQD